MKNKILITLGLIGALIPFNTKALTGSVNLSCKTTIIKPGESTECTIKGNINEEVAAVSMKLEVGENLTLSDIDVDSSWQGDGEGGNFELYTDNNKKGEFPIATFKVKAAQLSEGTNTEIKLSNINLTDKEFQETAFTVSPLKVRIPSTINTLNKLTVDGVSISGFSGDKTDYSLTVGSDKKSIKIEAIVTDSNSKLTGDTGEKSIKYGNNTFNIKVTSEMGVEKNYKIMVTKPEIRELKTLSINEEKIELTKGVYEYKYTVKNEVTSVDIKAELNNEEASFVDKYGSRKVENLEVGNNEILVKVKDSNNEELTYKIIVNRLKEEVIDGSNDESSDESSDDSGDDSKDDSKDEINDKDNSKEENPDTYGNVGYGILALVAIIVGIVFIVIKKRSKFSKKA